jgi:hypothetical protein
VGNGGSFRNGDRSIVVRLGQESIGQLPHVELDLIQCFKASREMAGAAGFRENVLKQLSFRSLHALVFAFSR